MISSSRSRLSYKDRRSHQKQRFRFVGVVIAVIAVYLVITEFAVQTWKFQSESMLPGYPPGTRVLVTHYILRDSDGRLLHPPERGDIVAIHPPYAKENPWLERLFDPLVRLISIQRATLAGHRSGWEDHRVFKRVIGIPGDTITLDKSVAYVRGADDAFHLSEFEMSGKGYDISVPRLPEGWTDDMPLSGKMEKITLAEGEYFLLGDNRGASNDSRYWGAVSDSVIKGRVIFAYWPLRRFGLIH